MKTDNPSDNEFYILQGKKSTKPLYRRVWFWLALAALAAIILAIVWQKVASPLLYPSSSTEMCEESALENTDCVPQCAKEIECLQKEYKECLRTHTMPFNDTVCNSHRLRVYSISDRKSNASSPRGKSTWRALCEKDGEILVIESDNTTFHDFANALSDYGVSNAIYLVDGQSYGFCRPDATQQDNEPNTTFFILR